MFRIIIFIVIVTPCDFVTFVACARVLQVFDISSVLFGWLDCLSLFKSSGSVCTAIDHCHFGVKGQTACLAGVEWRSTQAEDRKDLLSFKASATVGISQCRSTESEYQQAFSIKM